MDIIKRFYNYLNTFTTLELWLITIILLLLNIIAIRHLINLI